MSTQTQTQGHSDLIKHVFVHRSVICRVIVTFQTNV